MVKLFSSVGKKHGKVRADCIDDMNQNLNTDHKYNKSYPLFPPTALSPHTHTHTLSHSSSHTDTGTPEDS